MPKETEYTKIIPKIYRYNYEKLALFFFIRGQLQVLPTMQLKQAIENFRRFTGITESDWDTDCIRTIYNNIRIEFIDLKFKNECTKKNNRTVEQKAGSDK